MFPMNETKKKALKAYIVFVNIKQPLDRKEYRELTIYK